MTDTIGDIQGREYRPTLDEVRDLGALSVGAGRLKESIGTTYLRSLVRYALDALPQADSQAAAVDRTHNTLYPSVLAGVTTPDVAPLPPGDKANRAANKARALERNARSNFARTAASTVRGFLEAGGSLTDLDVATVTKSGLAHAAKHPGNLSSHTAFFMPNPIASDTVLLKKAESAAKRLLRATRDLKAVDPLTATPFIDTIIHSLQNL